jgi:N-acetylglucosaminyl-diphospho-decaprenol L-rhamnosyltransferase
MDAEPDFLEHITAPLADPSVGMVAGLTLQPGGGECVDAFGVAVDRALSAFNRLRHEGPGDDPDVLAGPSGGAAAYRRAAWEAVGGFDDAFFAYGEDLDLALRLRLAGWRAAAAPLARGVHGGGATTGLGSEFQRRQGAFMRGFLLRRYGVLRTHGAGRALLVDGLVVAYGLARFRSLAPVSGRIAGWRAAAKGPRLPIPPGAVDERITLRTALRRLANP